MERDKIKEKEIEFLYQEYKKTPQLFQRESFIEGPDILEKLGIFIEGQEKFPLGYLKLWPQDFIVEEILEEEKETIYLEDFSSEVQGISEKGLTIYATLVKCGLSTIEAIEELSKSLGCPKEQIQFAGIKDKDALTSQKISFRKISIERLQQINSSCFFLKNIYQGKGVVEKGSLRGNNFTILVRTGQVFNEELFLERLRKIEEEGFFNFYYLQRFGTPRLINFYWGLFILRGEYNKAVLNVLCSVGEREMPYFRKIRDEIRQEFGNWGKIEKMIEPLPLMFRTELKLVRHLQEKPKDFKGALNQVPEQITLWLFALSSWLFNQKLSFYLKNNMRVPEMLPLFLSLDEDDWFLYKDFLTKLRIFPPSLENLKPFPYVQLRKRLVDTKNKVEINKVKTIKEGVILDFFLSKGAYATTFLAQLFKLVSGFPPEEISDTSLDIKASLGEKPLKDVLSRFEKVIFPKTRNIFEEFSES